MKVMRSNTIREKAGQYRPSRSSYLLQTESNSWQIIRLFFSALVSVNTWSRNTLFTAISKASRSSAELFLINSKQNKTCFFDSLENCLPYQECTERELNFSNLFMGQLYHKNQSFSSFCNKYNLVKSGIYDS